MFVVSDILSNEVYLFIFFKCLEEISFFFILNMLVLISFYVLYLFSMHDIMS